MTIQLSSQTITAGGVSPPQSYVIASYRLDASGDVYKTVSLSGSATDTDLGDWISPKSGMSGYECRFTVTSGSISFGTTGTWLDLSSTRDFGLQDLNASGPPLTAAVTVEIRDKATQTVQASCTVNLLAYLTH